MIIRKVPGDIFKGPEKHIAFAINVEGYNDSGFAGVISANFWPQLVNTGTQKLGTVLSKECKGRTFHAIVCHGLKSENGGWEQAPQMIKNGLDSINTNGEPIAIVPIGAGLVGMLSGADPKANIMGMEASKQKVILYGV